MPVFSAARGGRRLESQYSGCKHALQRHSVSSCFLTRKANPPTLSAGGGMGDLTAGERRRGTEEPSSTTIRTNTDAREKEEAGM